MKTKGFVKRVVGNEDREECEDVEDMKLVLIEFSASFPSHIREETYLSNAEQFGSVTQAPVS